LALHAAMTGGLSRSGTALALSAPRSPRV